MGGREDTARRGEAGDVVVGRLHAVASGESRGGHGESRLQLACGLDFEAIVQWCRQLSRRLFGGVWICGRAMDKREREKN